MPLDVEDLEDEESTAHVICNPSTGQSLLLPKVRTSSYNNSLGFDPIGKGTGEIRWRKIKSHLPHYPRSEGICSNGDLYILLGFILKKYIYYLARGNDATYYIVGFDARSEKFNRIY
ncbi:hypothetical protein HID58_070341 [Brassica napus]|uniref:F-box associated beta-propeller type 3 domain-containing protein n=1 Tax=Brassica napus TaxID=3708 RepID=A0ABQ7YYH4_BRANA|nr:hypothetical protein HID58_070341 [Brassica napus]